MKKLVLSLLFVAMTTLAANAQEIKYGAKAGLNIANQTGDVEDAKFLIGLHLGGFAEIKLAEQFAFQPELLYSIQGAKYEFSEEGFSEEGKVKLSYLNIPLMLKYYATESLFVEAGPQIGLLLSAKEDYSYNDTEWGESGSEEGIDVKDAYKSIDFGLNLGLGYNITENIFAGARYNIGLSNILDFGDNEGDYKVKNSVIQVSVGYRF